MPLKDIIFMLVHRGYRNLKSHRWINRLPFRLTKKELLLSWGHQGPSTLLKLKCNCRFYWEKNSRAMWKTRGLSASSASMKAPQTETVGTETLRRSSEWKYETFKLHKVSLVFSWHWMLLVLHHLRLPVVYRFRISWWAVITQQEDKTQRKKRKKVDESRNPKILHVVISFFGYNLFSKIF